MSCHGDKGQGVTAPAIIGRNADLAKYGNGKGLYDFVSGNMPQNNPGGLSSEQYLDVVSFLLVQNGAVKADQPLAPSTLAAVPLQR